MTLSRKTPLGRQTPLKPGTALGRGSSSSLTPTELKRGTSQLKRTPFTNRGKGLSKKRATPRPHVHDTFRRIYKEANPFCELANSFKGVGRWSYAPWENAAGKRLRDVRLDRSNEPASELHHVFGGIQGNVRHDELSFVIHLSAAGSSGVNRAHEWSERYVPDGLTLCIAEKLRKGEFDVSRVEQVLCCESQGLGVWLSAREPRWPFAREAWVKLCLELGCVVKPE